MFVLSLGFKLNAFMASHFHCYTWSKERGGHFRRLLNYLTIVRTSGKLISELIAYGVTKLNNGVRRPIQYET
jgi:hypothetical protein